jgi:hypothetical protein
VSIIATIDSIWKLDLFYFLVRVIYFINKRALYRWGVNALATKDNFGELDLFYSI